jgi:hypothetical protein
VRSENRRYASEGAEIVDEFVVDPVEIFDSFEKTFQFQIQFVREVLFALQFDQNSFPLLIFKHLPSGAHLADLFHSQSLDLHILVPQIEDQPFQFLDLLPQLLYKVPPIVQTLELLSQQLFPILQLPKFHNIRFGNIATFPTALEGLHEMDGRLVRMIWIFVHSNLIVSR